MKLILALLLCFASNVQYNAGFQDTTQPKTILDYYLKLPEKYFEVSREERVTVLLDPKRGAVVDAKNGYLYAGGDGAQADIYMCLFRNPDGTYVVGVKTYASDTRDITYLVFYSYKDGQWLDMTKTVLPVAVNRQLKYDLPRYGTTIRVTSRRGKRLYDLIWTRGMFKLKRH